MKPNAFIMIVLLALSALAVPSVLAGDESEAKKEKPVSSRDMKKYDTDKDGKLSPEEQAVRDADKQKAKAERKAKKEAQQQEKSM